MRARRTKSQETERRADRQREREGESETTGVPESIFSSLVTLSSLHSSLSPICQRLPPLQQVAQPTRWTPPSLSIPLTYSDNLTPDSDLVSENLRQPAAAGPIPRSPRPLYLSIYLSAFHLIPSSHLDTLTRIATTQMNGRLGRRRRRHRRVSILSQQVHYTRIRPWNVRPRPSDCRIRFYGLPYASLPIPSFLLSSFPSFSL